MTNAREVIADWLSEAAIRNGFENSRGHSINNHADAIIAALSAAGFAIVPKEPTPTMFLAGCAELMGENHDPKTVWRAMVGAATDE